MVIILEPETKKKTFAQKLSTGIGRGLDIASQFAKEHEQRQLQQQTDSQENQFLQQLTGMDFTGVKPELKKAYVSELLKGQSGLEKERLKGAFRNIGQQKSQDEIQDEMNNYRTIEEAFGKKFADIWRTAPTGGKTELIRQGIDAKLRGHDIQEMLSGFQPGGNQEENLPDTIPQIKDGEIPKEFNWPNFSKRPVDYTPKEWNDERKTWRKENSPIFDSNKTRLKSNVSDARDIKKLTKLNESKKLPEGMGRAIIDPETGDIRGLAQLTGLASPETQEWVKIASRFQNRAKDAFGSRVTNFDLMSYMKQFPGLLNTTEGRNRILKMMDVNNKLDNIYDKSLDKIYKRYGLSGISQENADRLAQEFIKEESLKLESEYLALDDENMNENESNPAGLSGRMVDVMGPDGKTYEVDESEIEMLPEGFRLQ